MSNFIGGLIQFVFRIEEQYSGKIYGYFSNKTLSSKLEYLHFSFAAWPENQENALTHTHTLVRVHTKHSELKGFKKVEIMSGYPFIHLLFRDCGQKIMTYFYTFIFPFLLRALCTNTRHIQTIFQSQTNKLQLLGNLGYCANFNWIDIQFQKKKVLKQGLSKEQLSNL